MTAAGDGRRPGASLWASARMEPKHRIVAATFLATFTAYVERVGFSIAFTAMAKAGQLDEAAKGTVLSAFYWGYGLSQIPGGWAAQRYGGRLMLALSFAAWSVVSLLTLGDARRPALIMAARVAVGIAQGFIIPAVHTVLSQWIPPHERARAVSLTTSGMYLGSAAAMLVLPGMATSLGPGALLRLVGLQGLAWTALWLVVGRQKPPPSRDSMPLTTKGHGGGGAGGGGGGAGGGGSGSGGRGLPMSRMLRSMPIWAIVVNNFAFHYAFYVVMNWLPTYFNSVLKVELASLGALKTLPYLTMFGMSNVGGWLGDWLIAKHHHSVASARKAVNTLGFWSAAGALLLMPAASGVGSGVLATTLVMGTLGLSRGGFSVNHMDIAPKYAGIVMGVSNTAGTLAGVIGVAVTGLVLDRHGGAGAVMGWYMAHAVCAAVVVMASFVFQLYARGEKLFD